VVLESSVPKFSEFKLISLLKIDIESARLKKLCLKSDADICLEELSGRVDSIKELNSGLDRDAIFLHLT
jgi:hypothetical protein